MEERNMSLLHFHKITKAFTNRQILDDISLSIEKNERVALIGKNGTGKSTLLRIAMGLENPDSGRVIRARGSKIGYLSQLSDELMQGEENALYLKHHKALETELKDLEDELARPELAQDASSLEKVLHQYQQVLSQYEAAGGYTLESKIKKTLLGLGLSKDALYRPLDTLSGGERIRVALARILIESPDLLILDEPTNHLDLIGIEWLEQYLKHFPGGVLLVSHDRYFLDRVSTRTAELDHGHLLVKSCSYSSFIEQKEIQRAYYLKEAKNLRIRIRDQKAQVKKLTANNKIKQAKSRNHATQRLEEQLKAHQGMAGSGHLNENSGPRLNLRAHGHISKDIVWAHSVSKHYGSRPLFTDVNFNIYGGDRVGIIGPNGCGKSTLLKMLMEEDTAYSGELMLGRWLNYCYLGQSVSFENESSTILEHIMQCSALEQAGALRHLADFQFYEDQVNTALSSLSGGERVRVYLAEIMLQNPHLLILDEPTNHLDLASRQAIEHAVNTFRGTVIAVSHDRYYLNNCVDKILAFENGHLQTYSGNYDAYKTEAANR
jgi:ATP-binding cassette subfamily F protein 3